MDWNSYLKYAEKKLSSPILYSLLKKASVLRESDSTFIIQCENIGTKLFLDNKLYFLQKHISDFFKKDIKLVIVVKEKKRTLEANLPLISYQNSFSQLLDKAHIQSRFSFETFAVSSSNQIAHAAALSVAENLGQIYNPLFIYGGVGVGKTHLMQAIGHFVLKNDNNKKVYYCSSEEFTNSLIESIRNKTTDGFRKKYRDVNLLMVDDIQFIAGKTYVQEEFYHTFNTIIQNGGQIVLTSDRPPREIKKLEDRLQSRFSGGLTIDIQKPDFELRTAIVLIKAKERMIDIDIEVAKKIAELTHDTRELEGMLLRIYARFIVSEKKDGKIKADSIIHILKEKEENIYKSIKNISPQEIIKKVSLYYGKKPNEIKGESRKNSISNIRHIIMYILRTYLNLKLEEIAYILKRKDHTTIIHGVNKIQKKIMKDEKFKKELENIISSF